MEEINGQYEKFDDTESKTSEAAFNQSNHFSSNKVLGIIMAVVIIAVALLNIIIPDKKFSENKDYVERQYAFLKPLLL